MFQPRPHAFSRCFCNFELHRSPGFLLDDHGSVAHLTTGNDVADTKADKIAASEFAIESKIEQSSVSDTLFAPQPKPNSSDVLFFERPLGANHFSCIPRHGRLQCRRWKTRFLFHDTFS